MKWIRDFVDTDHIVGQLLVVTCTKGTTDKGLSYLNITFQDKTGTIEAKKWDASEADLKLLAPGSVVMVDGIVNLYKGQPQLKVVGVGRIDPADIEMANFARVSPIPLEELKARLDKYLNSFKDKDVEKITKAVINHFYDRYVTFPGAVKVHHEFGSGIIHHSLFMADVADAIAKIYTQVDRDILVAGALLHDIGKTIEYENPIAPVQTAEGKLCGHIAIGYAEFKRIVDELDIKSEVPLLLEHMILAHHGSLEFGSPVMPATREALL
ncbi:MAG: HDIG domain-containing protein, partial [Bacilli bacterium]|nr:HDIG domain-containing protein [Bacilli bacterium]